MAALVLGAGGAFVGNMILPGLGGTLGYMVGSAIGGALFGPHRDGPKTTDKKIQVSQQGAAITELWGKDRMAGNVIWYDELKQHKGKSHGKGSPKVPGAVTYTLSFAVGICRGPIDEVLKIWADNRLVWGPEVDDAKFPFKLYLGTTTQLPDPTQEAVLGVGNVPGYRGTAYVQFTDLLLTEFGDRLPNLTFLVRKGGNIALKQAESWKVDWSNDPTFPSYSYQYALSGAEPLDGDTLRMSRYRAGTDYGPTYSHNVIVYDVRTFRRDGTPLDDPAALPPTVITDLGTSIVGIHPSFNSGVCYANFQIFFSCGPGKSIYANTFAWFKDGVITYTPPGGYLCSIAIEDFAHTWLASAQLPIDGSPMYWHGYVFAAGRPDTFGDTSVRRWAAPDGAVYIKDPDVDEHGKVIAFNADLYRTGYPLFPENRASSPVLIVAEGYLWLSCTYYTGVPPGDGYRLFKLDENLNLLQMWTTNTPGCTLPGGSNTWSFAIIGNYMVWYASAGVVFIGRPCFVVYRLNDDGTSTFMTELIVPSGILSGGVGPPVIGIGGGYAAWRGGILQLDTGPVTLATIVDAVSKLCHLAPAQYDVSELTDPVEGYKLGTVVNGRAAIEPLMPVYQFDAVDSDGKIKFPKRKAVPVITIPDIDLGAHEFSEEPVAKMPGGRNEEFGLPAKMNIRYINPDADYQEGAQFERRQATTSQLEVTLDAPMVLKDARAKSAVVTVMYNAWLERQKWNLSVPRKYLVLDPTDVIAARGRVVRIVNIDSSEQGGLLKLSVVRTHANVFLQAPVPGPPSTYLPGGGSGGFVPQLPPTVNRTDALLLDLPLVTDVDATVGFYGAFAGRTAAVWPGCELFRSLDGGVNYDPIFAVATNDSVGTALTALQACADCDVLDETSWMDVRMAAGADELASTTTLGLWNGSNKAALGPVGGPYELLQYRTALLLSTVADTRTYRISGFLRGRRGTTTLTAAHQLGDKFIALPCHNIVGDPAEIGASRFYKAVTFGDALANTTGVAFTNNAMALVCYPPVCLGGGRNGAGDATLSWIPRTRIGGAWLERSDAPISESTETYNVLAYTDATHAVIKRQGLTLTPSVVYTAAQQLADFGLLQPMIYWGVQQKNSYGYGPISFGAT